MSDSSWLREVLDIVEQSLAEPELVPADLAARAYLSRYHFDRLVRAALGEPPGAFRRRLLLERAADQLVRTDEQVIDIARTAGYSSPDAFGRAFAAGYGCAPSTYRRSGARRHDLPCPNGIHFHPLGGLRLPAEQRSSTMDVLTRMYDHHVWLTGQIVDRLGRLDDDVLDRPIELSVEGIDEIPTLRGEAERLVRQLEMWVTAVEGGTTISSGPSEPAALRERLDAAAPRFAETVVEPVRDGRADDTFVDATCNPPQTFSLGGVLAHVLTFSAVRRTLAIGALETAGIADLGAGDPMTHVGAAGEDAGHIKRNFE